MTLCLANSGPTSARPPRRGITQALQDRPAEAQELRARIRAWLTPRASRDGWEQPIRGARAPQVAAGHDPDEHPLVDDRQAAEAVLLEERHRLAERVRGQDGDGRRAHAIRDRLVGAMRRRQVLP